MEQSKRSFLSRKERQPWSTGQKWLATLVGSVIGVTLVGLIPLWSWAIRNNSTSYDAYTPALVITCVLFGIPLVVLLIFAAIGVWEEYGD